MAIKHKDFYALQNHWNTLLNLYIYTRDPNIRMQIIDDLKDFLVDISKDRGMNLRSSYDNWEIEWLNNCEKQLDNELKKYPFEFGEKESKIKRLQIIKQDNNYKRLRKIMELIQDSIGLGHSGTSGGAFFGPRDQSEYTKEDY